nr:LRR receptor-like serine/threonine-protein kinase GSO1 [Triticum aestivum]
MPRTTNLLLILISISIFPFFTNGALQPQHQHAHGGGCIPAERAALLSFKEGVTSNNTNLLASWQGQDCCRWRGVSCSNRTGHVIKLRLRNPNVALYTDGYYDVCGGASALFGEISPSLLSLKHLEYLDLSMNCLLGPDSQIPLLLGSMGNLRYLNLSGIPFIGRVPSQLGNMSKLQYLDLGQLGYYSDMYSTDITWLTKLPFLQFLGMSGVKLSGIADWPHTMNMIPSLRVIDLSHCQLDSANQSVLHLNLTELEKLDMSFNDFEHSLTSGWFWKVTSLKYLDVGETGLFGQFPDTLGNMTYLQVLDISFNENSDMMMTGKLLKNLCSLEIIDLSGNNINEDIAVLMESLPQCTRKKLQELYLGFNNFNGTLPNFISDFTRLSILTLLENSLVGPIPPQLANLTCLTYLDLRGNHLTGSIPTEFGALTTLTSLYIYDNDLTGSIPAELGNLSSLSTLALWGNEIAGSIPPQLGNLTCLTSLELSDNLLTGNWRAPFKLDSAWFVSCQMGPLFPPWLQQLKPTALDISSNALKSEFPDWFWSAFSHARYLDISNNEISGSLPANLDDMAFEHLYLSSNQLTGPIPTLPANLDDMSYLNLSYNSFSGRIPSGPQLDTLSAENQSLMYIGNSGLCGPAVHKNCSGNDPSIRGDLETSKQEFEPLNFYFGLVLGFVVGLWMVFCALLFKKTWRIAYFRLFDRVYDQVYDWFVIWTKSVVEIPANIPAKLQFIKSWIDLSYNSLTGEIPTDITSLDALVNLNLSSNQLSGQIPNMIGAMQSLESLDLSQNKLDGEIPSSLTNLTSLSYLDLSYNRLSGRIPTGPQLDTLSAENQSLMYIGNSGLCGPPVHKNCSGNDPSIHGDLESSKQEFDPLNFYFGLVLGFVVGLWMVFCALLFKKTWRIAYFRLFDEAHDRVYVFVVLKWASFTKNTVAE